MAADSLPIGASADEYQQHKTKTIKIIDQYKKAGYLILRRDGLIHAPMKNTLKQ